MSNSAKPFRNGADPSRPLATPTIDNVFVAALVEHASELRRCCQVWMNGNEADADEAFSRASFNIYRKLPEHYQAVKDLKAWMQRLTRNVCMDLHRETRRRSEESLEPDSAAASAPAFVFDTNPEQRCLKGELREFLLRSVDELPDRLRAAMRAHLSSASYGEVADRLQINETNVRKRMQEARKLLRQRLSEYRAGRARLPALRTPQSRTPAVDKESPPEVEGIESHWRIHAIRPVAIRLPCGVETEELLYLDYPPQRSSERRRAALESYIRSHPRGWKKRLELGRHLLEAGRLDEAIPHFEHVVLMQPRQLEPWLELIAVYRLQERRGAASAACERALAAVPGVAAGHFLRGQLEHCRGRDEAAEQSFEAMREAMPKSPVPWVALAEIRRATGRPTEASTALDAALAIAPDDVVALTIGYDVLRLTGRSAQAERRLARAVEIDGSSPVALALWFEGRCRATKGRFEPGSAERRRLVKIRQLAQTGTGARRALAVWRFCRGDRHGGEQLFAELVRQQPRLWRGWVEYARLLDSLGKAEQAAMAIDNAGALHPPDREVALLACRLYTKAHLGERARSQIEALLRTYGDAWDVASTAAWAMSTLGLNRDRALELSRIAVDRQPSLPAAWVAHGRLLSRGGRRREIREAIEAFETARRLVPDDDGVDLAVPAMLGLTTAHRRLGDRGKAQIWARRAWDRADAYRAVDPAQVELWRRQARGVCHEALEQQGKEKSHIAVSGDVFGMQPERRLHERSPGSLDVE